MKDREQRADRLLSGGHPSGARLDRVWAEIEPAIAPRRSRSLLKLFFTAAVPVAAVFALMFLRTSDPFLARGDGAPLIEATCGSADHPCRVGEPIHLRLLPGSGAATVSLLEGDGEKVLATLGIDPKSNVPVPIRITPEARDVARGIDVRVRIEGKSEDTIHLSVTP